MAENTKALRTRMKSVNSTLQLTNAMELVASSKIRRANEAMQKAREYTAALEKSISLLTSEKECLKSPYMRRTENPRTKIIVIAGDRGLAGGYNANVFRLCNTFPDTDFIPIGKRACERFDTAINSSENFSFRDADVLADNLCRDFNEEKFDRLGVIFTRYNAVMSWDAEIKWLLPFHKSELGSTVSTIFEPDPLTVINLSAKEYVTGILIACLKESFACEVASRRIAMDSAGKNAKQMIDDLKLQYNRARQSAITQEITEIVAGSD